MEWVNAMWQVMRDTPQHQYLVLTKRPKRVLEFAKSHLSWFQPPHGPLPNVWLGVTVENADYTWRVKDIFRIPAAVHWVSAEPLLGRIPNMPFVMTCPHCKGSGDDPCSTGTAILDPCAVCNGRETVRPIDWLVVGGLSGGPAASRLVEPCPGHFTIKLSETCRRCNDTGWAPKRDARAWVRELVENAATAKVPVFFKQWGGPTPKAAGRRMMIDGWWREFSEYPPQRSPVPA
jgi:hypothetical protein